MTPLHDEVVLRDVMESDLPIFFEHQCDPEANRMAAFPARDREAFMTHWEKILRDETVITKAVVVNGEVAGNVVSFESSGLRLLGYWLGQEYWGRRIASAAVAQFLIYEMTRPICARVSKSNFGSIRVLEKCGFLVSAEDMYTNSEGVTTDEFIMVLRSTVGTAQS